MISASRGLLLAALLALAACGPNTVKVQGRFPSPLMDPLPLRLAIWYPEEFRTHEIFDEAKSRSESDWIVNTGDAQVDMWDTLLEGMFMGLVHLDKAPVAGETIPGVDVILVPHVDELQYAIPQQTNVKVYEIWMRYRFELLDARGEGIAGWAMPAYGKTPTAFLQSDEEAVNLAAVMALRDAGANFAMTFPRVPQVRALLGPGETALGVPALGEELPEGGLLDEAAPQDSTVEDYTDYEEETL